ncbi:Maf family protein [Agromyces seonyuensis]|uniref:Nucleoside triphosphate pyrophosphatase n=1 Tax=Agromyces seonyuensis TaxID=2662446 RepID=A0A6I4P7N1_9MICO|nr:Maf family protein [Agromyces seonyuensis]MWB99864.1 septum formation protein Maf [Agromyces seonyuensis]
MRLYLASTSPARRALLGAAGIDPVLLSPGVDEEAAVEAAEAAAGAALPTEEMVQLLARAKAEAVIGRTVDGAPIDGFILGGDSSFLLDGISHGKPHESAIARERWLAQRGRTGMLWSGHWLIDHRGGRANAAIGRAAVAGVTFADVTDSEIDAYIATGEPLEVAGAFTVDSLGGPFITRVEGDPSTVVGLSLSTLRELVRELGGEWTDLWNR